MRFVRLTVATVIIVTAVTLAIGANQDASQGGVQVSYGVQLMKLDPGIASRAFSEDANADTESDDNANACRTLACGESCSFDQRPSEHSFKKRSPW